MTNTKTTKSTKSTQPLINNQELARHIKEVLGGDYKLYEIEDILDAVSVTIPNLVLQGNKVRLGHFGTFRSKVRKESTIAGTAAERMIAAGKSTTIPARTMIEFDPSVGTKSAFSVL